MVLEDFPDDLRYRVVINHEEQYSIWPADGEVPEGWRDVPAPDVTGFSAGLSYPIGTKQECLAYIEEVWTDMRPLDVHREMLEQIRRDLG